MKKIISYWVLPVIAGVVWLGMLLGLLLHWIIDTHRTRYVSMDPSASVAYISDVGASDMKPLFVAGCVFTAVLLDAGFVLDRWLRHAGRLVPNLSRGEKALKGLAIAFAILGAAGLILLSIFDTVRHPRLHDGFLLFFLAGYLLSAVFICWEYQRLGIKNRNHPILRTSFWIKLGFVLVELVLALVFIVTRFAVQNRLDVGAVVEWVIAFVFSFYVFSFALDLYPAVHTRHPRSRYDRRPTSGTTERGAGAGAEEAAVPAGETPAGHPPPPPPPTNF